MLRHLVYLVLPVIVACGPSAETNGAHSEANSCDGEYRCTIDLTTNGKSVKHDEVIRDGMESDGLCHIDDIEGIPLTLTPDHVAHLGSSPEQWTGDYHNIALSTSIGASTLAIQCKWLRPSEPRVTCIEYYTFDKICASSPNAHQETVRCDDNVKVSECKSRKADDVNEYCSRYVSYSDTQHTDTSCAALGYESGVSKDLD